MPIDFKKIDKKKFGVILLALVSGSLAVILTNHYINQSVSQGPDPALMNQLMEKIGQLEQNDQTLYEKQMAAARQLEQRINSVMEQAQAMVVQEKEQAKPKSQSLALSIPVGKRAVTIRIQTLSAVGGLISPGDLVDIIAHLDIPTEEPSIGKNSFTTVTLFQAIQVLAVGPYSQQGVDLAEQHQAATISLTLAVDPKQAELLTFAESRGKLQLVLRSPSEKDVYLLGEEAASWGSLQEYLKNTQGVILKAFDSIKAPEKIETKAAEPASNIQIIRGGQAPKK